jgi:ribosomal-protein-alanine N-acetyltransferase
MEYDGEIAGQLNVWGIARGSLSSATIGYWVGERFAGRDITPTCVALATDVCFRELGLHRMEICIRPENKASLRVVEKLGFRYEGLRRRFIHIAGDWRDHYAFALVREEVPGGVLERWVGAGADGCRDGAALRSPAGLTPSFRFDSNLRHAGALTTPAPRRLYR